MRGLVLTAVVPLVAAHGFIESPTPRKPGDAFAAACGQQPYSQQSSDINGNVQGILQVVGDDYDTSSCNLWLCKGFKYDDNTANVQSYSLGQTIDFSINIAAPHTGVANVSVVKTSSNSVIGQPLIEFDNYASNAGMSDNNTAFSVTMPSDLGSDCTTAGDCVLQWWWDAPDIDQTYESCVDFTVGGGGNGGGDTPAPSSTPVSSAIPTPVPTTTAGGSPAQPTTTQPASQDPSDECPDTAEDEDEDDEDDDDEDESGNTETGDECEEDGDDEDDEDDDEDDDECLEDGTQQQSKRFEWKEWSA